MRKSTNPTPAVNPNVPAHLAHFLSHHMPWEHLQSSLTRMAMDHLLLYCYYREYRDTANEIDEVDPEEQVITLPEVVQNVTILSNFIGI